MNIISLGQRIRETRLEHGMKQAELAQRASVSRATLSALETGQAAEIGLGKLLSILEQLGLTLSLESSHDRRPTLDELYQEQERENAINAARRQRYRG